MLTNRMTSLKDSGIGSTYSGWLERDSMDSGFIEDIDFLFPNGITVTASCDRRSTLSEVKSTVWDMATKKPGAEDLRHPGSYVFVGRTGMNTEQEFDDDTRINDLDLVFPVLEISEPIQTRDMKELREKTGKVVGVPVQIIDQRASRDKELRQFRTELMELGRAVAQKRENWDREQQLRFFFPAKMDLNLDLPLCTENKLLDGDNPLMDMDVWQLEEGKKCCYSIQYQATDSPCDIIQKAIGARSDSKGHDPATKQQRVAAACDNYRLKVAGREDYMLLEKCIHTYEYVRNCINRDETPQLQIVTMTSLLKELPDNKCVILKHELSPVRRRSDENQPSQSVLSWDLPQDVNYCIKVQTQPGKKDYTNVYMEAQLFNGDQPLSKPLKTLDLGYKTLWHFGVSVQSLPRTARLCFITFMLEKPKPRCLNWVNMQVFDHNGLLRNGEQELHVFQFPENYDVTSYPFGTPGGNWDNSYEALKFEVVLCTKRAKSALATATVTYPSDDHIDSIIKRERAYSTSNEETDMFTKLQRLVNKDPLYKMSETEKIFLWHNRVVALKFNPELLPKVVAAVDWKDRHQVFMLHQLLSDQSTCQVTSLTTSLQLLGPWCPDRMARNLAVDWLRKNLDATHIELYMLQLVQIVKFDCYLNNGFVKFLLETALLHRRIGHKFFWLMRAEMGDPVAKGRFAVVLEAYCLHCGSAVLDNRLREVMCLDRFTKISTDVKKTNNSREGQVLKDWVNDKTATDILEDSSSLLHPSVMVGKLVESDCRVMTSKMRPIMLTFTKHLDPTDDDARVRYILKNGDDLRQDILVVQMLNVMDMLWKHSCHDLRTTVYDCMAMTADMGLIEVVPRAKTICEIERDTKTGPTKSTSLHEWLYIKSMDTIGFPAAVNRFVHSCAGFCVSTFLLGIGDRHSDNIMLTEKGKIFNIDFGHFLNHKKSKGGIDRERTPFILTNDFVNIIVKGSKKKEADPEFEKFLFICFEAYMTIRKQSGLFLTLLSLMIQANLPELNSTKEIEYCRQCLGFDKSDPEAAAFFYEKLFKSYKGQWATKLNWFCHRFYKAMKT